MSTLSDRLNLFFDHMNYPTRGRAQRIKRETGLGVSDRAINKWLSGDSSPEHENLVQIASHYGINFNWLAANQGKMRADENAHKPVEESEELNLTHVLVGGTTEYPLVPVIYLDIKTCCGSGYVNDDYPEAHTRAFTVEFLRDNGLPTDGRGLRLMHACGDSMGYTVPDGALILVNTNESQYDNFVNNKVYVFNTNSGMVCRRAIRHLDNTVTLKSDNSDKASYPDQAVTPENFDQLSMFGRVHYVFSKV